MTIEFVSIFSTKICTENPDKIYVFGDNFTRYGKRGQAVVRGCKNTYGIPTKVRPTMDDDAFLSDDTLDSYIMHLARYKAELLELSKTHTLVFPIGGIGTGLSQMPYRCPQCFKALSDMLETFTYYKHTSTGFVL